MVRLGLYCGDSICAALPGTLVSTGVFQSKVDQKWNNRDGMSAIAKGILGVDVLMILDESMISIPMTDLRESTVVPGTGGSGVEESDDLRRSRAGEEGNTRLRVTADHTGH